MWRSEPTIDDVVGSAFRIPTDAPEADGTIAWSSTTLVVVQISSGKRKGVGYTYAAPEAASLVNDFLAPLVRGQSVFAISRLWESMIAAVRNVGRPGISATAISAVDVALWDLKAKLLDLPLAKLMGEVRAEVVVYGSGGFTSYSDPRLCEQLADWVGNLGCRAVKMKVGAEPDRDLRRVKEARNAVGEATHLFVDANGAYSRKQALWFAEQFADLGVTWFEEPVSSDDLAGLRLLRDRLPAGMEVAAGEYGFDPWYFKSMLEACAVDVLQADATRCGGFTGFLRVANLSDAFMIPISAHTAPALHLHVCCAAPRIRNIEWFHDHARIEHMLFDGTQTPCDGVLRPDYTLAGLGLEFDEVKAKRFAH